MSNLITYGIDVSEHNGVINWPLVKGNTPVIDYVYIKATEGATRFDSKASINAQGCVANKIPFGYYHFAYMNGSDPAQDATIEANYFLSKLQILPKATMAPVLDIESNPGNFNREQVQVWIKTFLDVMAKNGYPKTVLYSYTPFLNDNLPDNHIFGNIPLWIAAYVNRLLPLLPKGWKDFHVWQFTGTGRVQGITGDVDINRAAPGLIKALKIGGSVVGLLVTAGLFFLAVRYVVNRIKEKEKKKK